MAFGGPFNEPFGSWGAKKRAYQYKIPAAATPEGQARVRAYYEALGQFVAAYAGVEAAVQYALRHYARTPSAIAQSIFSGTRVNVGGDFIRRICEATNIDPLLREELDDAFAQLRIITKTRDYVLHYGAQYVAEGKGVVTNALVAHIPAKVQTFPISPEILDDMTGDLNKIATLLLTRHAGRPPLIGLLNQLSVDAALRAPWRYRPEQLPRSKDRK